MTVTEPMHDNTPMSFEEFRTELLARVSTWIIGGIVSVIGVVIGGTMYVATLRNDVDAKVPMLRYLSDQKDLTERLGRIEGEQVRQGEGQQEIKQAIKDMRNLLDRRGN